MAEKAAKRVWKCIVEGCEEEFQTGKWKGCCGDTDREHVVEAKTFYHLSEGKLPSALKVNNVSALRQQVNPKGITVTIPGKKAQFLNGIFVTSDPETQFELEKRGFTMTAEQFREAQETDAQKAARSKAELHEERTLRQKAEAELAELRQKKSKAA